MVERPVHVLSLCAGGGGLDRGVELALTRAGAEETSRCEDDDARGVGRSPATRTVAYVELDVPAAALIASRIRDRGLPPAPIWTSVKTFDGGAVRGAVDCIIGGYPCQPFSVAGNRRGTDDPRHLWPHIARIVRAAEPQWCFFENVAGHLALGFDVVARDLQGMGYEVAAALFTASEAGAPHSRERLFILAHRSGARRAGGKDVGADRSDARAHRGGGLPARPRADRSGTRDAFGGVVRVADADRGGYTSRRQVGKNDREPLLPQPAVQWPTPKSRDWKGGQGEAERHSPDLDKIAESWGTSRQDAPTGEHGSESLPSAPTSPLRLNPMFVEWLMGWEEGWTSLEQTASASSETESCLCRLLSHCDGSPARWA